MGPEGDRNKRKATLLSTHSPKNLILIHPFPSPTDFYIRLYYIRTRLAPRPKVPQGLGTKKIKINKYVSNIKDNDFFIFRISISKISNA